MKISFNWLNDYIFLGDKSAEQISEILTALGFEIEGIDKKRYEIKNVVIAKVLACEKHPNADKLSLCRVSDGKREFNVVCGAANVHSGLTVPLAYIGATIANGVKLKRVKIRGINSEGMICSAAELGLEPISAGIMELPKNLEIGHDASEILNLPDTIFEVNVTPNRGDALSHLGIARELSAFLKRELNKNRDYHYDLVSQLDGIDIEIKDPDACPRYTARIIRNIEINESPSWLKTRLFDIGLNPLNEVVDFTNFVMFDSGQPLHAFDLDKLKDGKIVIRYARVNEKILLLNNQTIGLTGSDLLICDAEKPIALAGIMGGQETAVSDTTKNILLESAFFSPHIISCTSKRHGIMSDSSFRFERFIDINNVPVSSFECAKFFEEYGNGIVDTKIIDKYPIRYKEPIVDFSYQNINNRLGLNISPPDVDSLLASLGFEKVNSSADKAGMRVPSFRRDILEDMDFAEEIIRHFGFSNVPVTMPKSEMLHNRTASKLQFRLELKQTAVSLGFNEVVNYSFLNPDYLDLLGENKEKINIVNELSMEQKSLRTSLMPQLIQNFKYNVNHDEVLVKLFELGKIYFRGAGGPTEEKILAGIAGGKVDYMKWFTPARDYGFYDLKGEVSTFLKKMNQSFAFTPVSDLRFFDGSGFYILDERRTKIGAFGLASIELLQKFELDMPFGYFEFFVENLHQSTKKFAAPPRFPSLKRDISLVIDKHRAIGDILEKIKALQPQIVEKINIFDVYESKEIGPGLRSITMNIVYRSKKKTLTDKEVNRINEIILKKLQQEYGAKLRERRGD